LRTRWPLVFPENPRKIRPFMRGIHREIAALLPGTGLWLIKRAIVLFQNLNGDMYWQAVLKGGPRYALDGSPRGEVTPREQEHARQALAALAETTRDQKAATPKGRRASSSSSDAASSV
jgi:sRNA-binding protein